MTPRRSVRRTVQEVVRVLTAGWRVFPYLAAVLVCIGIAWMLVARTDSGSASQYTTAIFLGSAFATVVVIVLLGGSRELSELANLMRRLQHQTAAIALVFDASGRVLMHFQSAHGATSWAKHWVPPGGLVEDGRIAETARQRLRRLVHDHDWGTALSIATTNDSAEYRKINKRASQVPVKVEAYWFKWSDDEPFVPDDEARRFDFRTLRLAHVNTMPDPVPEYYSELFECLEALARGDDELPSLSCWSLHETGDLKALLGEAANARFHAQVPS